LDIKLSSRVQRIKPSPTLAVSALANQLKAEGKDIVGLGAGEPDFDTPEHICEAAIQAIHAGQTHYTAVDGTASLKQAIIDKFERENGLSYAPDQILVSCGGKQSYYNLCQALLDAGDEVIIPAPYWVSYPDMVLLADGEPVIVYAGQDQGFKLLPEQLEAAITPRTIVLNGVSKAYAMTGWRIGYAGGPKPLIAAMKKIQSQSTSNPTSVSQAAAEAALNSDQSCIETMRQAFEKRHAFVVEALNGIDGISCLPADGTFYSFPQVSELIDRLPGIENDTQFAEYLLEQVGVALVPGTAFGAPGHVRISFATSMENLEKAMERIRRAAGG
jgi:aspartate aminotransferase